MGKSWREFQERALSDPEARAAYEKAKKELDAKWEVYCRDRCCIIWVHPDSNVRSDDDDLLDGVFSIGCRWTSDAETLEWFRSQSGDSKTPASVDAG